MNQVSPVGDELIVVAGHVAMPAPVAIARFGHRYGQVISQRIGIVALQCIQHPHAPVLAAADLAPFHIHELVGRHVVGQVELRALVLFV